MLDLTKAYTTRGGHPVRRLRALHNYNPFPISGEVCDNNEWRHHTWTNRGYYYAVEESEKHDYDLVPIDPTPKTGIDTGILSPPHKALVAGITAARDDLVNSIDHGDRRYDFQRAALRRYQQFQIAADKLAGYPNGA